MTVGHFIKISGKLVDLIYTFKIVFFSKEIWIIQYSIQPGSWSALGPVTRINISVILVALYTPDKSREEEQPMQILTRYRSTQSMIVSFLRSTLTSAKSKRVEIAFEASLSVQELRHPCRL